MSIRKSLAVLLTAGVVAIFGLSAKPAHAQLTPELVGAPVNLGGGIFSYTYDFDLNSNSFVGGGSSSGSSSFITLYDIEGYVAGSAVVSSPTFASSSLALAVLNTGVTPADVSLDENPLDDPALPNITAGIKDNVAKTSGFVNNILVVSFHSTDGVPLLEHLGYTDQTFNSGTLTPQGGDGDIILPSPQGRAVPEPASYAAFMLGGLGLLGLGLKARRRQTIA